MNRGSWIARARRHRLAIGLIAAYALLLSSLLPAFAAAADPLQAALAEHLCGPGGAQDGNAPGNPADHKHDCPLCGPSCAMGGCVPVAALSDGLVSVAPFAWIADAPHRSEAAVRSALSLYPSDAVSQGPPQAA